MVLRVSTPWRRQVPPEHAVPLSLNPWAWWSIGTGTGDVEDTSGRYNNVRFSLLPGPTGQTYWDIRRVDDLSGNQRHTTAIQGSTHDWPYLWQNDLNGRPSAEHIASGGATFSTSGLSGLDQPYTAYVVTIYTIQGWQYILGGTGSADINIGRLGNESPAAIRLVYNDGATEDWSEEAAKLTEDVWEKWAIILDGAGGTTDRVRINGTLYDWWWAPSSTVDWADDVQIGCYYTGSNKYDGRWTDILLFDRVLSSADQSTLDTWVNGIYGV